MADTTRASAGFHPRTPSEARVLDYLLGGKDNFAADREAAERAIALAPELPMMALESRKFLGRAVRFLADEGIRQFVDIGCGLPTQNNAHEVAQAAAPESRVVYVDIDPVVVSHASAILAGDERTGVIQADMREPDKILAHPGLRHLIDLDEPVAILLVSAFTAIPEDEVALDIVARLRQAISSGSWMVISHPISDSRPQVAEQIAAMYQAKDLSGAPRRHDIRSRAEVEPYFDKLDMADPGIVRLPAWRPGPAGPSVDPKMVWAIGGVGRKL
ncbi:SAM-dependent methyltransferase [Actinoallomurus bryophytorum]|uniref:S-adenosyl methyltransferase n=1 Tax=Actinoallomurus bryophytorum TaxID=1490222 RepID=A0A543CDR1_9ACTN|nr:SAM-dependent methyltransferase [Actinoallomurus bryophytorum]TQL95238.1 S-adenosyl methyltransferase [Actinoallomurus bryophytorum]